MNPNSNETMFIKTIGPIRKKINYDYLPDLLTLIPNIEEDLKERLLKDLNDQQKLVNNKEEVYFYTLEIDRDDFKAKFNFKLEDYIKESIENGPKLETVSRLQLILFTPKFWTSLSHIFIGMKIVIIEEPPKILGSFPTYLVCEIGVGMTINKVSYEKEEDILKGKKPIFVLAKEKTFKLNFDKISRKNLDDQRKAEETQRKIKKCWEKLTSIKEMAEMMKKFHSDTLESKIAHDLDKISQIAKEAGDEKLIREVEEIRNNELCPQNAKHSLN